MLVRQMKKIDRIIARETVDAKAIRVFSGKILKEVDSSKERGENPHLYVQKTYNEKRRLPEIQIVLMGEHHIEDLNYFNSDPRKWTSFGAIILSVEDAEQLAEKLKKVIPAHEEILKAMTMRVRVSGAMMPGRKAKRAIVTLWKRRIRGRKRRYGRLGQTNG